MLSPESTARATRLMTHKSSSTHVTERYSSILWIALTLNRQRFFQLSGNTALQMQFNEVILPTGDAEVVDF